MYPKKKCFFHIINPLLANLVRSRLLDFGIILFSVFTGLDPISVNKYAKSTWPISSRDPRSMAYMSCTIERIVTDLGFTRGHWPICLVRLNALLQILGLLRYCFSRNFCATFRCSKGSKRPSPLSTKNKLKLPQAFFSYVTGLNRIISPNSAVIEANPP